MASVGLERGLDGGELIKGRKRHLLVDTLGLMPGLLVHSAGVQDRAGGRLLLEQRRGRMPRLRGIWADAAYRGRLVLDDGAHHGHHEVRRPTP